MSSPYLRRRFGLRLQELRCLKDMTQAELAEKIALSTSFVSSLERGIDAPSFETLEVLAQVLDIPVIELFNFENLSAQHQVLLGNTIVKKSGFEH